MIYEIIHKFDIKFLNIIEILRDVKTELIYLLIILL